MANKNQLIARENTEELIEVNTPTRPIEQQQTIRLHDLYQRHEKLHLQLQDVINLEMIIENAIPCISGIRDLLSEIKEFLNKEYSLQDDASWPTFIETLNTFQKQINFYVQQAKIGETNLLLGDNLSLEINDDHNEFYKIRGQDLSAIGLGLDYIDEDFTSSQTALYTFYKKLEPAAAKVRSYRTYIIGAHTIIKNQRQFTERRQNTLQKRIDMKRRKNIKLVERIRSVQTSILKMRQHQEAIPQIALRQREQSLENALNNALESFKSDQINEISSTNNDTQSFQQTENLNNYEINQDILTSELFEKYDISQKQDNENEKVEPVLIENEETNESTSSFFDLFKNQPKDDKQEGIRSILERLKHSEDLMSLECLIENTHTLNLNQLCAEILRYIDHETYLALVIKHEDKTEPVYVENLCLCIKDRQQDASYLFTTDSDFKELFNNYEGAFQDFVKQQKDNNQPPEMIETYVRKWLSSPYGEIYKIIFSVCRNNRNIH